MSAPTSCFSDACLIVKQVSLKSRDSSARQRENDRENCNYPEDYTGLVMNDVDGSSTLAGKYALYRPRPGKNVSPARMQVSKTAEEHEKGMKDSHIINLEEEDSGDICRPASELTFIYETVDKARMSSFSVSSFGPVPDENFVESWPQCRNPEHRLSEM